MRNAKRFGAAVAALALLAVAALPILAASPLTVGQFVQRLAESKNLNATDAALALDSLRGAGVRLPVDMNLSKRLTESDVADIARAVGIRVTTSQPDAVFSDDQVDRFFLSFAQELGGVVANPDDPDQGTRGDDGGPTFDPFSKGKGKGKGKGDMTPTEPE